MQSFSDGSYQVLAGDDEKKVTGKETKVNVLTPSHPSLQYEPFVALSPPSRSDILAKKLHEKKELEFHDIVEPAPFAFNAVTAIAKAFNEEREESFVSYSSWRGTRIEPNQFMLVHRNNTPELVAFNGQQIALPIVTGPGVTVEMIGVFNRNTVWIGAYGSHVINVPFGCLAPVTTSEGYQLLGQGVHVIHDQFFRLNNKEKPSEFDRKTDLLSVNLPYIHHGDLHIVRVPEGTVAKAMYGSKPAFLGFRPEPYVCKDFYFSLDHEMMHGKDTYFFNITNRIIKHRSLTRANPKAGEVIISYKGGDSSELVIIDKPKLITDPNHSVGLEDKSVLITTLQTLEFPSEETVRKRKESKASAEELQYEVFYTQEACRVAVKLVAAYTITDPHKAISSLGSQEEIQRHIEKVAVTDMGKVVQQSTLQKFVSSTRQKITPAELPPVHERKDAPSAPEERTILDEVKAQLAEDLSEYGIKLVRLSFELPEILDQKIRKEMSEQALTTTQVEVQESMAKKKAWVAQQQADQEASVASIKQKQVNANIELEAQAKGQAKINEAKAELEAADMRAQAFRKTEEAKLEIEKKKADLDYANRKRLAELDTSVQQQKAELLKTSPELFSLEQQKHFAEVLKGGQLLVTPQELQGLMAMQRTGTALFGTPPLALTSSASPMVKEVKTIGAGATKTEPVVDTRSKTLSLVST